MRNEIVLSLGVLCAVGLRAEGIALLLPTPQKAEAREGTCRLARQADIRYVTDAALPKEGYRLEVGTDVTIASSDAGGRVHALQTLKQLAGDTTLDALTLACPAEVPCCRIEDAPRFPWRGYMLDTSRHFFGTAFIKKTLDAMAYHKLNVFHWHLADGAGWRFPVDAYPALTNACATRKIGKRTACWGRDIAVGQYGPFAHSREDIREILAYAAARGIEVVPEIDLPGHQGINGTFRFACCQSGLEPEGTNKWHGATGDLCVANPAVYPFYEKVLDELCEVFPSKVVHIGGDEVSGKDWARCPRCLALMREKGLKDQRELQNVIMRHFAEYLEKKGRRAIGWDEILIGGAMPQGTMMSHFHSGGKAHFDAVKRGHDVVMMPGSYTYFDCDQGLVTDPHDIYQIFNGRLDWRRAYAFDPLAGVPAESRSHVLGLQGCSWTEIVCDESDAEWGVHPRLACLAEVGWAYPAKRDADAFLPKLSAQRERLVAMGFDAAPVGPLRPDPPAPEPKPAYVKTQGFTVIFKDALAERDVTWTLDPSVPAGGYDLLIRAGKPYYREGSVEIRHSDADGKALGWKVLKQLEQPKNCNSLYLPKGELRSYSEPVAVTRPGNIPVSSPDGRVSCVFSIRDGRPFADVSYGGKPVFSSALGVDRGSLVVQKAETRTVRSAWKPAWGFRKEYPENYTELTVRLGREGRVAADETLYVRCYDEGFAVRAKVVLENYTLASLAGELSDWRFVPGTVAWGITSGEATYPEEPIDIARMEKGRDYMFPLTVRVPDIGYASVFEARAERYPRSYLRAADGVLRPRFATGVMEGRGEVCTPWRAVQLASTAAELVERAYFAENLNEACAIADTSWIKPGFCVSDQGNFELRTKDVIASAKEAAKIGAKYVQIDWGWYGTEYVWTDDDRAAYAAKHPELKDDTTWEANTRANPYKAAFGTVPYHPYWPYDGRHGVDIDIPTCVAELKKLGLGLCLYVHGAILEDNDLDALFATYEKWGIAGLKPGFVGYGSQKSTEFIRRMTECAARHHLWLDIHDAYLPDGMQRTWPNLMIVEGGGGEEGNHVVRQDVSLPFARCLVGPFDYTPCLFHAGKANATKLHKLAIFLAYPGPTAVMRGNIASFVRNDPEAAAFLRALPWTYDSTRVTDAEIGRHLVVVREREGDFSVAGLTGVDAHETALKLDFLEEGVVYDLDLLTDDLASEAVPRPYRHVRRQVRKGESLTVKMAASGGFCATLTARKATSRTVREPGRGVLPADVQPVMMMRLRMNDTQSVETWKDSFRAIGEHPGCCDEIWFSTGCGVPGLDWHRANAKVIAGAVADAKAAGIVPSLQFQATLGHGDGIIAANMFSNKTWTGWTGPQGVEAKECNCPRQPAFLAYLREVSEIYAKLGFASLWIDDDLRSRNHMPATAWDVKLSGCWCETCIAAYNRETGGTWTRETLAEAVKSDPARQASWRTFTLDSLVGVAKTVAGVFHDVSPQTMMGLQHCVSDSNVDEITAVLKALHEASGRGVGFRGGGGAYGDDAPDRVLMKSLQTCRFRRQLGNPDYVKVWVPEIESYPRTYYSISGQGVLVQAFSGLMHGLNGVSYFISNPAQESPSLYGETYWKTLAEASACLKGYVRTIEGCTAVGFTVPVLKDVGMLRAAIPMLLGPGKSVGSLTEAELGRTFRNMSSRSVQDFREQLDARAGGLPACVCSPFAGLMQIHVGQDGRFRTLALMNARIAAQGPVRVRLSQLPEGVKAMTWHEMGCEPLRIPLERTDGKTFATVPRIGAWNGGYLAPQM